MSSPSDPVSAAQVTRHDLGETIQYHVRVNGRTEVMIALARAVDHPHAGSVAFGFLVAAEERQTHEDEPTERARVRALLSVSAGGNRPTRGRPRAPRRFAVVRGDGSARRTGQRGTS